MLCPLGGFLWISLDSLHQEWPFLWSWHASDPASHSNTLTPGFRFQDLANEVPHLLASELLKVKWKQVCCMNSCDSNMTVPAHAGIWEHQKSSLFDNFDRACTIELQSAKERLLALFTTVLQSNLLVLTLLIAGWALWSVMARPVPKTQEQRMWVRPWTKWIEMEGVGWGYAKASDQNDMLRQRARRLVTNAWGQASNRMLCVHSEWILRRIVVGDKDV